MQKIAIIGAGGHAREQLDLIEALNQEVQRYSVVGFLVDAEYAETGQTVCDLPILGDVDWLKGRAAEIAVVCAIGRPADRRRLSLRAAAHGASFPALVHPRASMGSRVRFGPGTIIGSDVVITCDVEISSHVHINVGATVSHDSRIDEFATLAPGVHAAGGAQIGEGAEIGIGTTISDHVTIGAWAILGAGAVVVRDVPANATAVGVPARVIDQRESGWYLARPAASVDDVKT